MLPQSENQLNQPKSDARLQHYRVTLQEARRHYKAGHLTAKGLVYFAIAIKRKPGWRLRMSAEMAEEELGIKRSAFYNAISLLKADGWIEWEASGGINAWIPVMDDATEALPTVPDSLPILNKAPFPRTRTVVHDHGQLSMIAENQAPKPFQESSFEDLSDIYQRSYKSTATEPAAAAIKKSLEEDLWGDRLPLEEDQEKPVESDENLNHSTEMVEELEDIQREIGEEPKSTSKGKCSALQLEALKKLGLTLSHGFRTQLAAFGSQAVDKAIACFKEDKATWTAGPIINPTGYFITVLREVRAGRQPILQQPKEDQADLVEASWQMWRKRWDEALLPAIKERMKKEIEQAFPGGEIVVLDMTQGPRLSMKI